jgi:hypothetical protein
MEVVVVMVIIIVVVVISSSSSSSSNSIYREKVSPLTQSSKKIRHITLKIH